jgi:N-acetylglucosaminyl-diphospho-decaprenol L-rhamnosyltransferase
VIVTYNSAEVIAACLEALTKMAPGVAVIVVDNASSDGTVEIARGFRNVEVIANDRNAGFAAAVNQGFQRSAGEAVLVMNPDVRVTTPLDDLITACGKHGIAAGVLDDPGWPVRRLPTPMALAFEVLGLNRVWPSNPVNRRYRCLDLDLSRGGAVEQPAGAFLMIRGDVWRSLQGFDEGFYPVWFEDVDFSKRAAMAGYRTELVPAVRATHTGGHSVKRIPERCRTRFWYGSLIRYAAKHFGTWGYLGVCLAAIIGCVPRAAAGVIVERSWAPVATYASIVFFLIARLRGRHTVLNPGPAERLGDGA